MFSVRGDTVVDPFSGTGVTMLAAMASGRNSICVEIDPEFRELVESSISGVLKMANEYNRERLRKHMELARRNPAMKHVNDVHGFPVMTKQEKSLEVPMVRSVEKVALDTFEVEYSDMPVRLD